MLLTLSRVWEASLADGLTPLGLTTRKYGLLGHIRATPGISFSELARRSRISVQSAHTAVSAFVRDGLVDDGTAHAGSASQLRVTPRGESVLAKAAEVVVRLDQPMAAGVQHLERAMLQYALQKCGGHMEETAAMLGLSRKGLYLKRQRFGIEPPEGAHATV